MTRSSSSLPSLLRAAVGRALAVGACAAPAVASGGAVAPIAPDAGAPSSWVYCVQADPSHQRSKPGTPYGSGYQPEGGKSMSQG